MNNFTPRAQQVLALARKEADRFHHNYVGTEHLLLGLIKLFSARSWGFSISAAAGSVALIYIIFRLVFSVLMPAGIVPEGEILAAIGHLFGAAK